MQMRRYIRANLLQCIHRHHKHVTSGCLRNRNMDKIPQPPLELSRRSMYGSSHRAPMKIFSMGPVMRHEATKEELYRQCCKY